MPPGSTDGYVYVFDPGFCSVPTDRGTGDRWFGGNNAISSWYDLYDLNNTPYDFLDDPLVASSGTLFRNLRAADTSMGGSIPSGGVECKRKSTQYGDGRDYHDAWYLLNPGAPLSGGATGKVYRLHTTGTDSANPSAQRNANGEQSFSLYVSAAGCCSPRIYGFGAMQAFTPLKSNGGATTSEFYLAQIEAVHAGKTMELMLWDPGDTDPLQANVQILIPTAGGWTPTNFAYEASGGHVGDEPGERAQPELQLQCRHRHRPRLDRGDRSGTGRVQRLLVADHGGDPRHLPGVPGRLVEDQIQHERERHVQRRDHLEGEHPGQPGPPRPGRRKPRRHPLSKSEKSHRRPRQALTGSQIVATLNA